MASTIPQLSLNTQLPIGQEERSNGQSKRLAWWDYNVLILIIIIHIRFGRIMRVENVKSSVQRTTTEKLTCTIPANGENTTACFGGECGSTLSRIMLFLFLCLAIAWLHPEILLVVERANANYSSYPTYSTISTYFNLFQKQFLFQFSYFSSQPTPFPLISLPYAFYDSIQRQMPHHPETIFHTAQLSWSSARPELEPKLRFQMSTRRHCSPPSRRECGCSSGPNPTQSRASRANPNPPNLFPTPVNVCNSFQSSNRGELQFP